MIRGQNEGVSFILNAFSSWEFLEGNRESLVLAFTGPTGVGKSETAIRIGEALFHHKTRSSGAVVRTHHPCLLYLRGEDFSVDEAATHGISNVGFSLSVLQLLTIICRFRTESSLVLLII